MRQRFPSSERGPTNLLEPLFGIFRSEGRLGLVTEGEYHAHVLGQIHIIRKHLTDHGEHAEVLVTWPNGSFHHPENHFGLSFAHFKVRVVLGNPYIDGHPHI